MVTISQVVENIIRKSPFLEEALFDELINISSLARKIQPEIEKTLHKKVKKGAIIMAINRLSLSNFLSVNTKVKNFLKSLGDIVVRSGLSDYTFAYSDELTIKQTKLLKKLHLNKNIFCTFSQGIAERTVIISTAFKQEMAEIFKDEKVLSIRENLSSITIRLPQENIDIPGVYYVILRKLAWEGINLVEVISTTNEFTLVVDDTYIDQTFSILMKLKKEGG